MAQRIYNRFKSDLLCGEQMKVQGLVRNPLRTTNQGSVLYQNCTHQM
jgi:hypothetical protein